VGISGEALVVCTVGEDGRVSDAVVKTCDYEEFANLALEAVQRWTFVPGTRDGKPCAMRVLIPIRFEYPDSGIVGGLSR
jgi:TonB family protein